MTSAQIVAVFGSSQSQPGDAEYELGVDVGRLLAGAGFGVTNGGYGGAMEAVALGATAAGGRVIGVTAPSLFPGRHGQNEHLTEVVETTSLTERIHTMSELSSAAIVLPGSIGTLTELMVVWNDASIAPLRGVSPRPIFAMGGAWEATVKHLEDLLGITAGLITFADSAAHAVTQTQRRLSDARADRSD